MFQCWWIWWGEGVMQVHIRAKAAKNHSQLYIETHYSLQSIEGMSFFWWQQWFRFSFYFNIHGLLDQAFRIQVWNSQLGLFKGTLCFYAFLLPFFPFILLSCFPSLAVKPPRLRRSYCTPASCLFSPRLCFQGIGLKQGGVESQTANLSQSARGPGRAYHVSAAACGSLSVCTTHTGWRRQGADLWPWWVGYQHDRINTVLRQNSHIPVF